MHSYLVLATAGAALLVLFVFVGASPRLFTLATLGYILFMPKINIVSVPGTTVGLRGEDALLAILAVKTLADLLSGQTLPSEFRRVAMWLFALFPIGIIGILGGLDDGILSSPAVALLFLVRRYEYFLVGIATYLYLRNSKDHCDQAIQLLVVASYVNSLVAVAQAEGIIGGFPDGVYTNVSNRAIGLTGGPYELAALLIIILPLFLWRIFSGHKRASGAIGVGLIFTAMWFSESRVGLVSALIITGAMLFRETRRSSVWAAAIALIVSGGSVVWASRSRGGGVAADSSRDRFDTLQPSRMWQATKTAYSVRDYHLIDNQQVTTTISDVSYALRIGRWFNYFDALLRFDPLFGLGPSACKEAVDGNYVRVLFEFGLIGLVVFLFFLAAIRRVVLKVPAGPVRAMAVWGGLGLLMQATFIDVFEASKAAETYWALFGICIAVMSARTLEVNEESLVERASFGAE